jgi:hypothetical protein
MDWHWLDACLDLGLHSRSTPTGAGMITAIILAALFVAFLWRLGGTVLDW